MSAERLAFGSEERLANRTEGGTDGIARAVFSDEDASLCFDGKERVYGQWLPPERASCRAASAADDGTL
jgi:hypothetical protein